MDKTKLIVFLLGAFWLLLAILVEFGTVALVEILAFVATLIIGYIYVWKKGIFDWGLQARAEAREEAKAMAKQLREEAILKAAA